jgi:hypothetical protein
MGFARFLPATENHVNMASKLRQDFGLMRTSAACAFGILIESAKHGLGEGLSFAAQRPLVERSDTAWLKAKRSSVSTSARRIPSWL